MPDITNPQDWNRFSYVLNNSIAYADPNGHKPCELICQGDYIDWNEANKGSAWEGEWNPKEQEENSEKAEKILNNITEITVSTFWEPADWAYSIYHCANGDCSPWMLMGLLPIIPSTVGRHGDDISEGFIRVVREDWLGTSQAFKTDKLEDGLSVFKGVSPDDVLKEMPGKDVPNITIIIPEQGLPVGTQVIKKPGRGLSQFLSDAHYILVRPQGWSIDRFAKTIKKLVGWE